MMKKIIILISLITFLLNSFSQNLIRDNIFWGILPKEIFIRIFKHEKELEIWIKEDTEFRFFKKYKICYISGRLGPKRCEGDLQVPEGFYYINDFNFYSKYHLSLGINYPNESDRILSNCVNPGGLIYIHGDCVSVGCISMKESIDEIFDLSVKAKMGGQEKIPVHIFPINYYNFNSLRFFDEKMKGKEYLYEFEKNILEGFLFFEENLIPPKITIDKLGKYHFE